MLEQKCSDVVQCCGTRQTDLSITDVVKISYKLRDIIHNKRL